ncbi:hypothetical protein JVT61DRAFT_1570 [Boletus reticuloceps]|uniref:Uncharacterized protein n=1 Tax=Boletus reticuloceps TaxID=495285 RepID=A0A8I2YQY5_9AGAM|nr:hypothetical protein JVT61DRAFT_1570 [Boletus reticuloceps]
MRHLDVRFHIASAPVVEKVCEYMSFKAHYEGPGSKEDVPINEFTERIPPEIALELYVLFRRASFLKYISADPTLFLSGYFFTTPQFPLRIRFCVCRSRLLAADYLEGKSYFCPISNGGVQWWADEICIGLVYRYLSLRL